MIGLAACIVSGIIYGVEHRTQWFIFLERAIWGIRNVWKMYRKNA